MNTWKSLNPRARTASIAGLAAAAVVVLAIAWWLGSPLFINRTVNESFPIAAPAADKPADAAMAKTDTMAKVDAMAKPEVATQDAMTTGSAMKDSEAMAGEAMAKRDAPVALSMGSFTEVDSVHKGSGMATVYTLPDGKRVLRFENFNVTNGPDLFVYLSGHAQPRSAGELHGEGDFDLGRLKGNIGDQNYELPADLDLSKFKSVVIYCKQFSVVFSTATLNAAQG